LDPWKLEFSRDAAKALLRMPRDQSRLVRAKLDELCADPHAARNVRRLTNQPSFRMRIGDWRVIYLLIDDRIVIHVIRIAARGSAYQ
jgi:mRNA interferase RelE/StbE